ncbi:MAG: hypothetical protein A2096_14675 [Spirochaetes bacterium GWF1_41_5]|nr:MAG: hypothetical protein A2096_14675 [Spirochaetes bacterium GWF1_41_5]HBE03882.1 hypothetical protein [Spirochaetia bacterium]
METPKLIFHNLSDEIFSVSEVCAEIEKYINNQQDCVYNLTVGSDSLYQSKETVFVTAIIIHRLGKGARFFYTRRRSMQNLDLCSRLLQETYDSIAVVKEIEKTGIIYLVNDFSIHIDAGDNGDSRKILKECISFVKGYGYNCKVKPDSCAASKVADRFTK